MASLPLTLIWQPDLTLRRDWTSDDPLNTFTRVTPREHDWISSLLADFDVTHHMDGAFTVTASCPIVVLEGANYDPAVVQAYFDRLTAGGGRFGLIHIGDEDGRAPMEVYRKAAFVYRNYWHVRQERYAHCYYLPLGLNCGAHLFAPRPMHERQYAWSFAGQTKLSRQGMVDALAGRTDGRLVLNDTFNSGLDKDAYAALLSDTQVVLCPRGWSSVESYRLYEALEAGAIPLVEDDGGRDLFREHATPTAASTALRGGPRYWIDLARRARQSSYWLHTFGADFPCPRIYRWENVGAALAKIDTEALAPVVSDWWQRTKTALRADLQATVQRRLLDRPTAIPLASPRSEAAA